MAPGEREPCWAGAQVLTPDFGWLGDGVIHRITTWRTGGDAVVSRRKSAVIGLRYI
jgi:hypothetical protein